MKKNKFTSIAIVLFLVTVLTSCSSDSNTPEDTSNNETFKSTFAVSVSGPATGKVNEELSYEISFTVENGCGEFNKLVDTEIHKESGYQVEVKYPATCIRPEPGVIRTTYKTSWPAAGTYYVRIAKSEDEFVTTKVVIK
jgi:maltose-binding protein MalE